MAVSNGQEMLIRSLSGLICSHSADIKSSKKRGCQHSQAHRRRIQNETVSIKA